MLDADTGSCCKLSLADRLRTVRRTRYIDSALGREYLKSMASRPI